MILKYFSVFFLSMVPFIELRGGVVLGATLGLDPIWNYIICIIGNIIPVPFILFFARRFLLWTIEQKPYGPFMQKFIGILPKKIGKSMINITKRFQAFWGPKFKKIIDKAEYKASKVGKYELLAIFAFVAIPIPGTGAWMGTLIASILPVREWKAIIAIFFGVVAAGIIMSLASFGILNFFQ